MHEVVLDLQFHQELDDSVAGKMGPQLREQLAFDKAAEMTTKEIVMSVGPDEQQHRVRQHADGWSLTSRPPGWMLNLRKRQQTLHVIRPGKWPTGPYPGWQEIFERFTRIHGALEPIYGALDIKRAGLRYLNRIAVPEGADLDDWFTLQVRHPDFLTGMFAFDLRQTWATAGFGDDIGVTLRLVSIKIEDEALAKDHLGVALDIDVFNLRVKDAPTYQDALEWYARAHEAENTIFEASITDLARKSFNVTA